jgi:NADH:ubiquinone oxidoreductase subunit E
MPLETEATAELRALVADLRPDDADLLEALHRVQHRYGYVSRPAMHVIAEQLRLSPAHVFGVTTYYADFRTTPPPQVTVAWCGGPACQLRNGQGVRDALLATLGIRLGEQTADGRVGVVAGQCNGTCEQAPQLWVEERVVGHLTAARAVRLGRALAAGADPTTVDGRADHPGA